MGCGSDSSFALFGGPRLFGTIVRRKRANLESDLNWYFASIGPCDACDTASIVVSTNASVDLDHHASEELEPVTPHGPLPVDFEGTQPIRRLHERRALPQARVREARSVVRSAEVGLLQLHRRRRGS